jgi:hypothetical protein
MKRHSAVPMRTEAPELKEPARSSAFTQLKDGGTGQAPILRGEAVAKAIREWIVPLLVRTFLDEQARRLAAEPRPDDLAGTAP